MLPDFIDIQWIGYLASFLVLISLLMASIKRLRVINTIGSLTFAYYGFMISDNPVMIMNLGIAVINVYYLRQIFMARDYFKTLPVSENEAYTEALIDFYKDDIYVHTRFSKSSLDQSKYRFIVLRNMNPAGIFVAKRYDKDTLEVVLDYATPSFRDFKTGTHIYEGEKNTFISDGYKKFIAFPKEAKHRKYLEKMGFKPTTLNDTEALVKPI